MSDEEVQKLIAAARKVNAGRNSSLSEEEVEESGLQAYLGNKKYGKKGMDALRKAGRDGASKEKMAKIRAKYDKLDEQGVAEGLAPGQAAWKKEMMAKGAVSFKRDQHGGGAVDRIVAYDKDGKVVGGFNRKGVAEGSSDKVHLKTPKHGLADHPGRNTGVGLSTFAATSEQDRCPKCNSLYKNHYQKQGVAEGFSDVVKGIKRAVKGKQHPDVVASKHAGRAIGHYNQGDIAAGDKETNRYVKTRDMHLKAKGVVETKVDNYKDMGATKDTTHFVKNMTTGKIVSPHRSKKDAEDALIANRRGSKDEFKIVRARKESVDEDLDANQKRVGQLGPTEKVGPKGAVGKLVGANESVEHDPLQDIKRLLGK